MGLFHIADEKDIKGGYVTDVYFARTMEILRAKGIEKYVKVEIFLKKFPEQYQWGVFAGLEEALKLLMGVPVNVWAMREGTIFRAFEPVMIIEGKYTEFGIFETSLLGFLCHASGIATKAARCRLAAGDRILLSFGARRVHPAIAPMMDRSAFIGGCDAVSVLKSAEVIGEAPVGTIPHALVLIIGDTVKAIEAFHEVIDRNVRRVSLIDTFGDEKFEAIRVASALKENLYGVRLDTPASRKGDMRRIIEEIRWELGIRGFGHVKIFISGGLDEGNIRELRDVADGFGVGTSISAAKVLDFSLDIVEIDGEKIAKKGKESGAKRVWRCNSCMRDRILIEGEDPGRCACGGEMRLLHVNFIKGGKLMETLPTPREIREFVLNQLAQFSKL